MPNETKSENEIFHKYAKEQFFSYSKISQEIHKDFVERELKFSEELRHWVIQLSVIGSAIIGAIVAFGRGELGHNLFILASLILLVISVSWGLIYIKIVLENQMISLEEEHIKLQKKFDKLRNLYLKYFSDQNEQNKNLIIASEELLVGEFKGELKTTLKKDQTIKTIFIIFTIALFLLVMAIIDWNIVMKVLVKIQEINLTK